MHSNLFQTSRSSKRHVRPLFPRIFASFAVFGFALLGANGCIDDRDSGDLEGLAQVTRAIEIPNVTRFEEGDLPKGRKELRFAVTPYLPEDIMRDAFEPIGRYVSERLGVPVRFQLAGSYQELIELVKTGKVDIVQISPLSYVIAKRSVPGLRLLGSSLSFGTAYYSAFIIARADSATDWRTLFKNKNKVHKFAFVDRRSGSGFLFPYAEFMRLGIDPERDLQPIFSGSHDRSIRMVLDGEVAAAAVSSGTLNAARTGDVIGAGDLRILHKAGRIPYDALCTTSDISEAAAKKIAGAFATLNTTTAAGREALRRARGLTGWVRADDSQYDEVREKLRAVEPATWRAWELDKRAGSEDKRTKVQMFATKEPASATATGQ